jgi:uncharacterized protein (TIGR02646 family)
MRPVSKLKPKDKIAIDGKSETIQETYKPYSDAKSTLTANIDEYCSYCERPASDEALHIEHIQAKGIDKYKHLEFSWSNFLLACQRCNQTDNKGNKDVIFSEIHLPHLQNTMLSIQYLAGGFAKVHPNLIANPKESEKAKTLIELVGLDKRPGHNEYKPKDKRWQRRDVAWQKAIRYEKKFQNKETDIETIIDLAKSKGFFSVWFTVFENHSEVRLALIDSFKGTAKECFDNEGNPKAIINR